MRVILVDGSDALAAEDFVGRVGFEGYCLEPAGRIDCLVIDNDLKVKVASCGVSRRPYTANVVAGWNVLPVCDFDGRQMVVGRFQPVAMVDDDAVAAAVRMPAGFHNSSRFRSQNGCAANGGEVGAGVHLVSLSS